MDEGLTTNEKEAIEEEIAEEWVDRTNEPLREIGNGYELTSTLRSLYLTNNRLTEIRNLDDCVSLRELVLRQNAIKVVKGLDNLSELEELDLYLNQIEELPSNCFAGNPKLKRLDLSFNQLRELKAFPSRNLPSVEELYLIGNKIKEIEGLHSMPRLVMLELGDNRIRKIERLEALAGLQGLWLGRNKITQIDGLHSLTQLRRLSLQSNRVEIIQGLDHLVHLEELYLSHNGIASMHGIQNLSSLRVLDLGTNLIVHVEHVDKLTLLQEFWINGNKLQSFDELHLLRECTELETVYLEGNPLANDLHYQAKVLEILPDCLEQLDALPVEDVRRQLAERAAAAKEMDPADVEEVEDEVDDVGSGDNQQMQEFEGITKPADGQDFEGSGHGDQSMTPVEIAVQNGDVEMNLEDKDHDISKFDRGSLT